MIPPWRFGTAEEVEFAVKPIEFGDYTLVKKLAAGGMGEVFLAKQEQGAGFERYVAIKRVLPELSDDDEFTRMFLDEARLAAQLNHPNIVQIYDLGICGEQYYLAMEFLEGRDLRRIMGRLGSKQRALSPAHAVQIIYNAAEGLHFAHALKDSFGTPLNIIHRDVSPQNIFVSFHGTVKVLDFGIAKAEARSVHTRTGGIKGKYPYLSPEQVRGEAIDPRSDIFALGTVLWEITIGRRLFKRDNDLLTLQAVLEGDIPPPSALMSDYPRELEAIIMKALARTPNRRYSTCRALQEDLEQFVGQFGLVLSPQKLGSFVEDLFPDEPRTVTEILDEYSQKPRSRSLLHDGEGSASVSRAPGEFTDPSGSAVPLPADDSVSRSVSGLEASSVGRPGLNLADVLDDLAPLVDQAAPDPSLPLSPSVGAQAQPSLPSAASHAPPANDDAPGLEHVDTLEEKPPEPAIARAPTNILGQAVPTPPDAPEADGQAVPISLESSEIAPAPAADPPEELPSPEPDEVTRSKGRATLASIATLPRRKPITAVLGVLIILAVPVFFFLYTVLTSDGDGDASAASRPANEFISSIAPVMADAAPVTADAHLTAVGDGAIAPEVATADQLDAAAGDADLQQDDETAQLHLTTSPAGLTVMLGDQTLGQSPLEVPLPAGQHQLTLRGGGYSFGTEVTLSPGQTVRKRVVIPRGTLSLRVVPYAHVFVNGRSIGLTPMPAVSIAPGRHRVRLVNESLNRTINRTVHIRPGRRATLNVDMSSGQ